MDKDAKIAELERRINELERPTSLSTEFVQALIQNGFLQTELALIFTSGAGVNFINLLMNAKGGQSPLPNVPNQTQSQYVLQAYPAGYFREFSVDIATDKVISPNHGLSDGAQIWVMSTGDLPTGMGDGSVPFYVNAATEDDFEINLPLGTPVDITSTGIGAHYWQFFT